ncbi:hypothetical protein [Bradyrhizobium diazoefficiens]|uniref:hypothetical protein n=1 Tax=Bradyrhizobium diazoefficiens TaxID=1355477 RepID=UPI002714EDC1|nr:hypothetical protein [Bradyrhizobium diazoefficiens]WLB38388.1 hypothetical protein QIH78_00625 [Bradyrhizobium diazoefficiens]
MNVSAKWLVSVFVGQRFNVPAKFKACVRQLIEAWDRQEGRFLETLFGKKLHLAAPESAGIPAAVSHDHSCSAEPVIKMV